MSAGSRENLRRLAIIGLLAAVGLFAAGYVLVQQRLPLPFRDTFEVRATLEAADGVAPGVGQAVLVSGVKVGSIKAAELAGDKAQVTLELQREDVPKVYRNAHVDLRPITPVKDMEVELDPGDPPAPEMRDGDIIPLSQTSIPVELSTLLSQLGVDTRAYITSMLTGLGQGTKGGAPDLRKILLSLGPTTVQVREISRALEGRRTELARLVHNVSAVTDAATSDGSIADAVIAGNQTLQTIAAQDAPLQRSISMLPGALTTARSALLEVGKLSVELQPALRDLTPPVRGLPNTLRNGVTPISDQIATTLKTDLRLFIRKAEPLARKLQPAVAQTKAVLPDTSRALQGLNYGLNELGFNPEGKDEGMLYWFDWFVHNWNSSSSTGDAHGALNRAGVFYDCGSLLTAIDITPLLELATGTSTPCQKDG